MNGDMLIEKRICKGTLLFNRVVVLDIECSNKIYWNGYYGTFFGVAKPKEKPVNAPLELSLLEALYLLENNMIEIYAGDERVSPEILRRHCLKIIPRFRELYIVYKDLRDKGYVVRRGLKFGCDYLVYEYGPGIDHAPYGVQVLKINEEFDPIDLVRMGRLLHSVRKKLVIALTDGIKHVDYIILRWWRP